MCGIYMRIHLNGERVEAKDLFSLQAMSHRGPDGEDFFAYKNIGLAHKRLSIYDVTDAGRQPMHFNGMHMVYNGAVYNHLELKQELENLGHSFQSHADTEVILHAYAQWGKACFEKFTGQWALIIFDEKNEKIIVCRDRYGIKPLYKYHKNGVLAYASEVKALSTDASLNTTDLHSFLHDGITDTIDRSFYHEISAVNPATAYSFDLKMQNVEEYIYYEAKHCEDNYHLSFQDAVHQFRALLKHSTAMCLRSDVPSGISLSGGLDSNSIANITSQLNINEQKSCYIVDFAEEGNKESKYAQATIQKTGYKLIECRPTMQEMLDILPRVAFYQDLPFASMSILAQYLLFERVAHTEVKVMLSGQGADEILGGYDAFISAYYHHLKQHSSYDALKYLSQSAFAQPQLFFQRMTEQNRNRASKLNASRDIFEFQKKSLTISPLPALLRYEDRNSMAHGIESRLPFLDHRIVDFCFSLPINYIMQGGGRKPLLVEAMKGIVPDVILQRKDKVPYATPEKIWMKKDKNIFEEMAHHADSNLRDVGIDTWQNKGSSNLWRKISAGMWLEAFKK